VSCVFVREHRARAGVTFDTNSRAYCPWLLLSERDTPEVTPVFAREMPPSLIGSPLPIRRFLEYDDTEKVPLPRPSSRDGHHTARSGGS
jgi:hypothetical protein